VKILDNWLGFHCKALWRIHTVGWGALLGGLVGAIIGVPVAVIGSVIGAFLGAFIRRRAVRVHLLAPHRGCGARRLGRPHGRAAAAAVKIALGVVIAVIGVFAALS